MCYKRMYENSTSYIALQTSLKHIFIEELITKHISLKVVKIIPAGIESFSNPFWQTLWKSPCNKAILIKTTTVNLLKPNPVFECKSHCSYFKEQPTGLNCIYSGNYDNLAP